MFRAPFVTLVLVFVPGFSALPLFPKYAHCGDDLRCACQQACGATCNNFNISTTEQGEACGACMKDKCMAAAKSNCNGFESCLGCLVEKSHCFVNPVLIEESVAKCRPPLSFFHPVGCLEQWVEKYALHCVEGYFKCFPERPQPVVFTESGNVAGVTRAYKKDAQLGVVSSADLFHGIPFAAPPIGANRFRPPQPFAEPWAPATRDTSKVLWGNVCTQMDIAGSLAWGQEDCLYLDVGRPTGANSSSNLPVFVWLFGGGYVMGDAYEFGMYDAGHLVATHGNVIASMNYRLSALGFMALPELLEESQTTGNYAVQDQRAALQWVQRNIKYFGGDPGRVTLAGESAGAFSVLWHLVSPPSKGLFHAAIMESGTASTDWFFQNKTEAFEFYGDFAGILGCNMTEGTARLACLRKVPHHEYVLSQAQTLKDIAAKIFGFSLPKDIPDFASPLWPLVPYGPVIDGTQDGLLDVPLKLVQRGEFHKVPLLLGNNKDDGTIFGSSFQVLFGSKKPNITGLAKWFLSKQEDQDKMLSLYGGADFPSETRRSQRLIRDMIFACPNRALATAWSKADVPSYLYTFAFNMGNTSIYRSLGDAHIFELPFVWLNLDSQLGHMAGNKKNWTDMSNITSCKWASFIECRAPQCTPPVPNCEDSVDWPQFSRSERSYYSLQLPAKVESIKSSTVYEQDEFPGDDRCDFWDNAYLNFRKMRKSIDTEWVQPPLLTATPATAIVV